MSFVRVRAGKQNDKLWVKYELEALFVQMNLIADHVEHNLFKSVLRFRATNTTQNQLQQIFAQIDFIFHTHSTEKAVG